MRAWRWLSVPSDEPGQTGRSLGGYIKAIVTILTGSDQFAAARMQRVAAALRGRITLDDEAVEVNFGEGELRIGPADSERQIDGTGQTDRRTVLDLLAGRLEVSTAIIDGLIKIEGAPDAVAAMLLIIEIVLDAAPRNPALQQLADEFVHDLSSRRVHAQGAGLGQRSTAWYPSAHTAAEDSILARLDLLPDNDG